MQMKSKLMVARLMVTMKMPGFSNFCHKGVVQYNCRVGAWKALEVYPLWRLRGARSPVKFWNSEIYHRCIFLHAGADFYVTLLFTCRSQIILRVLLPLCYNDLIYKLLNSTFKGYMQTLWNIAFDCITMKIKYFVSHFICCKERNSKIG